MINKERIKKYQKYYYSLPKNQERKKKYAKEYGEKYKDKIRKRSKEYYYKNQDKVLEYAKKRYNTPEGKKKRTESVADWKKKNLDKYNQYHKEYRDNPEYKRKIREKRLTRLYKISLEEYESMFLKQNGLCAICGESETKLLAVDHNHKTGEVRGLLCSQCNLSVGNVREDIQILKNMVNYLNKH